MFAIIFICGNLFWQIVGKIAKSRTRKNSVPTMVPHGRPTSFNKTMGPLRLFIHVVQKGHIRRRNTKSSILPVRICYFAAWGFLYHVNE